MNNNILKFETLYSKDSAGRIRVWWMETCGPKYRTVSGLQGGEKVESEWTEVKGKNIGRANETTSEGQAFSEVQNRYKKQRKTGYFNRVEDVDEFQYIQPQLAKNYKDYADKIDFSSGDYCLQIKYNGQRCIATKEGLFTRKGERYLSVPHIHNSLIPFFEQNPKAFLDGELFNFELRQKLNELSTLTRKTKNITEEDLKKSKEIVQYHIYDGANFDGLDDSKPYLTRLACLEKISLPFVFPVKTHRLSSKKQFEDLYAGFIADGHEGAMVRFNSSQYERKRSKFLLKVKPEEDSEAKIIKLHFGQGNWNVIKTATLDWNGKIFDATFKGSYEECQDITNNQEKWLGKQITFNFFGLTGLGCPQFANISISNCFKN